MIYSFFVSDVSLLNFDDDNIISPLVETILELINILQSGSEIVINWFKSNKMIVNPDKFQAILLDKRKSDHTNQCIVADNQNIKVLSSAELLRIQIDDKLNFNLYISNICRSTSNQSIAFIRLKRFLGFKEKRIVIKSFSLGNFNYCRLVWMFSSASSLKKIENLKKGVLKFLYNDYGISYEELLLKSDRTTMNVNRLRNCAPKSIKILTKILNPKFMRDFLV